jgi:uncharacterized protein
MLPRKYFPLGLAHGDAFCNRVKEKAVLNKLILEGQHTILSSPRRYGKSSLVTQVVSEIKLPHFYIDLLLAGDENFVKEALLTGISGLLTNLLSSSEKLKEKIINIFHEMKPEISLGVAGVQVRLFPNLIKSPASITISESLLNLDRVAQAANQSIVIIMDEFQQISSLSNHLPLEASIRHAAERSEKLCFVFSGSNRHLLNQMFNDKSRPLYNLCRQIQIQRISGEDYEKHLQKAAIKRWKTELKSSAIRSILELTQRHPYYMNLLCQIVWEEEKLPTDKQIHKAWFYYLNERRQYLSEELLNLSPNQRTVLRAFSENNIKEPYANEFVSSIGIPPTSVKQALRVLMNKDFIYKHDDDHYRIVDPAIYGYLQKLMHFTQDLGE